MSKHSFFVFAILLGFTGPASIKAAVEEEYKSIEELNADQSAGELSTPEQKQASQGSGTTIQNQIHNNNHIVLSHKDYERKSAVEKTESVSAKVEPALLPPAETKVEAKAEAKAEASALAYAKDDVVIEAEVSPVDRSAGHSLKLTPLFGASVYHGQWSQNIRNQYTLGLAVELPISRYFAFEAEGGYANYRIAYTPNIGGPIGYSFNQYLIGGNGKVYLMTTKLRPYLGAGMAAVIFDGMTRTVPGGGRMPYNPVLGSANLMAGLEFDVSDTVSLGARGSWMIGVINRPMTVDNGATSAPGFEEAAVLNTNFYRIQGTVSVKL